MEKRPTILLVEKDPAYEKLACSAIAKSEIDCDILVARSGDEACQILCDRRGPVPALVLLELDIPKPGGLEVLAHIRRSEATKRVPVIVVSSAGQAEVDKSFDLHANSYVQKVLDPEIHETRMKLLLYYWMAVNRNGNA